MKRKFAQVIAAGLCGVFLTSVAIAGSASYYTSSFPAPSSPVHQEWTVTLPNAGNFSSSCNAWNSTSSYANALVKPTSAGHVYFVEATPYSSRQASAGVAAGSYNVIHNAQNGGYVSTHVTW
ncbi:MAG TPA: hypothetical protein VEQ65_13215 [Opitutus sp.]|nr:hypothetical protein [Opitutus sp.]